MVSRARQGWAEGENCFTNLEPAQPRPSEVLHRGLQRTTGTMEDTEVQTRNPTSASPLPGAYEPVSYVTSLI